MPADILARGMAADALRQIEDIAIGTSETKIIHRNTHYEFPAIGNVNFLYIADKENLSYRWDEAETKYYPLTIDYTQTEILMNGGKASG